MTAKTRRRDFEGNPSNKYNANNQTLLFKKLLLLKQHHQQD
jgi:hypothetical protein